MANTLASLILFYASECSVVILCLFLLQIGAYVLLQSYHMKRFNRDLAAWGAELTKASSLEKDALVQERKALTMEKDARISALQEERDRMRSAVCAVTKAKEEAERRMLEREVAFLEREGMWAKDKAEWERTKEFTISKHAADAIAGLTASLHAAKLECEAKDVLITDLTRAKDDIAEAKEREISCLKSWHQSETAELTGRLQAAEMQCKSKELANQTRDRAYENTIMELEERVLTLTDKLSEYRIQLIDALSSSSPTSAELFYHCPSLFDSQDDLHWSEHKQTQSAQCSPFYHGYDNPDKYDRSHIRRATFNVEPFTDLDNALSGLESATIPNFLK